MKLEDTLRNMLSVNEAQRKTRIAKFAAASKRSIEEATAVDDAFLKATGEAAAAIGRALDTLPQESGLQGDAIPYVLRGVLTNLDTMEDLVVAMLVEIAMERGVPISVVEGGRPDCLCPACTAVREANASRTVN